MVVGKRTDENVKIGAETAAAERGFKKLTKSGKAMVAAIAAASVAAGGAATKAAIGLFRVQEQAEIRLRRTLVASGQYSAEYEKRLHDISNSIQATTTTGDEAAMHMLANFISIGKVAPDSVDAITRATIGYAELTGKAVNRVHRTWAQSLADIGNESKTSLGEMEQLFTGAEQAMLRTLKETEGGLAAQAAAIALLNKQFGEHALSVQGSTDVYLQLKNRVGDFGEEVGRVLHRFTGPLATKALGWFDKLVGWTVTAGTAFEMLGKRWDVVTAKMSLRLAEINTKILKVFRLEGLVAGPLEGATKRYNDAVRALAEAEKTIEDRRVASDAPTTGPDRPQDSGSSTAAEDETLARQVKLAENSANIMKATLQGMKGYHVAYLREAQRLDLAHADAQKLLAGKRTRALGEAKLEEIKAARSLNQQKYCEELIASQEAVETEIGESGIRAERLRDNAQLIRDMEREQQRTFDAEDLEYLADTLRSEEEVQRAARDREIQAAIDQHAQMLEDEKKYGKTLAAIKQALGSKQVVAAAGLMGTLADIANAGGKKMQGIAKAAALGQLIIDLQTKPFDAYAKTSSAYPFPFGHALGMLHAGLVVAQLGIGMANVGGGGRGGGGGHGGGHAVSMPGGHMVSSLDQKMQRDREPQVINLTVELDGRTLAQVVQEHLAYAEDE